MRSEILTDPGYHFQYQNHINTMQLYQSSLLTVATLATLAHLLVESAQTTDFTLDEESSPNKLVFLRQGLVASSTSFAHASFDVNISDARASIEYSRDILHRITQKVVNIMSNWENTTHLNKRAETVFWDTETSKVHDEFHYQELQLNVLADSITYQDRRQPRQLLVAGLAAASGFLLGGSLFNLPEIYNLRATMTSNSQNIKIITHSLGKVADALSAEDEILHSVNDNIHRLESLAHDQDVKKNLLHLRFNLNRLSQNQRYRFSTFSNGLSSLLEGHLNSNLVSLVEAEDSMSILKKKAELQGLNLVFPHPLDFYKCRTTLFRTEAPGILAVFVHVPTYRAPLFHLYKFVPLPILISTHNTATPLPKEEYLLVNPQRNLYQVMTASQFATCENSYQHDVTFCQNSAPFRKNFEDNCLSSLYINHQQGIVDTCKFSVSTAGTEIVLAEDDSSFIIYSPTPISVRISCDDRDTTIVVDGYHHLRVNATCSVSSPNYFSRVEASIKQQISVSTTHIKWNASDAFSPLLDVQRLNFTSLDTALSSHDNLITSLLTDVARLNASVAASPEWSWVHYHSITTAGVVLLLLGALVVAGVLVFRRYRQRLNIAGARNNNEAQQQ